MHIIKASQYLIHEVLIVIAFELLLRVDKLVEVCLHQLSDNIDIIVTNLGWWLLNVYQLDYILMLKKF